MARWEPRTPKKSLQASLERVNKRIQGKKRGDPGARGSEETGRTSHQGVGVALSPKTASLRRETRSFL